MSFPGKFTEHFLPEHMNRVSLSFLVDTMDKRRGGCAPNIAYTLALLGERPLLMATAGEDFGEYRQWLESAGIDTSLTTDVRQILRVVFLQHGPREQPDRVVLHRRDGRRRTAVVPGPSATAGWRSSRRTIPARCSSTQRSAARCGIPYIFDPGQQCARMSGDELHDGVAGATFVIVNDYELELLRQKTGLDEDDLLAHTKALIVTRGEKGSSVLNRDGRVDVPAVEPYRIVDPTGVGDAYRGGLMKGLALSAAVRDVRAHGQRRRRRACALEHLGGLSHAYTWDEFRART